MLLLTVPHVLLLLLQAGPESLPDVWTQLQDIVKQYKQ